MKIGIIGTGKVGTTFSTAFERQGHEVRLVSSRQLADAQWVVDQAEIVFLAVSDGAIGKLASDLRWNADSAAVHCSGALGLDVLAPAALQHARVASFHPLQMFADVEAALKNLVRTTITLEGDSTLLDQLEKLARQVGARPVRLQVSNRALYHTSVNYAGPFVIALLREASRLWTILGFSEEQALSALIPLIEGTLDGVKASGLAAGMGGAVARGDVRTIERHINALREHAPEQLNLYCDLANRTIPLALERHTLDPEIASTIRQILAAARDSSR